MTQTLSIKKPPPSGGFLIVDGLILILIDMTMILGLNLSDRVYLAADTRVTRSDGSQEDHILKVMPLINSPSPTAGALPNNIMVAVAGDIKLATFFYTELKRRIDKGDLPHNIRLLDGAISEELINSILKEWTEHYPKPFGRRCCLLFAGQTSDSKKVLDGPKLQTLMDTYKVAQEKYRKEGRPKIIEALRNDPTMRLLNEKLNAQAGKGVLDLLEEGSVLAIPPYIQDALLDPKNESSKKDSFLFSREIVIEQGGVQIRRETAEWGQLISRGSAGISSGDISSEILAAIELRPNKGKTKEHLMEGAFISSTIRDMARERGVDTIGGQVLIAIIQDGKGQISGSGQDLKFTPAGLLINIGGAFRQVVPFTKYLPLNSKAEALLRL